MFSLSGGNIDRNELMKIAVLAVFGNPGRGRTPVSVT